MRGKGEKGRQERNANVSDAQLYLQVYSAGSCSLAELSKDGRGTSEMRGEQGKGSENGAEKGWESKQGLRAGVAAGDTGRRSPGGNAGGLGASQGCHSHIEAPWGFFADMREY